MAINEQQTNFDNLVINIFLEFYEASRKNTFIELGHNNFQNKGVYKLVLKGVGNISQKVPRFNFNDHCSNLSLYYSKKDMHDKHYIFVDNVFAKDFYDLVKEHTSVELMPEFYKKITCVVPYTIIFPLLPQEELIKHLKVFTNNSLITQIEPLIKMREILRIMKSLTIPTKEISDILLNLCNSNKISFSKVETQNLLHDFLLLKGISQEPFANYLKELNCLEQEVFINPVHYLLLKINKRKLYLNNVNKELDKQFELGSIFQEVIDYFSKANQKNKYNIYNIFLNNLDTKYPEYYITIDFSHSSHINWQELIEELVSEACFISNRNLYKKDQWTTLFDNLIRHYELNKIIPDKLPIKQKKKKI